MGNHRRFDCRRGPGVSLPRARLAILLTFAYLAHIMTFYFLLKWIVAGSLFAAGYGLPLVALLMGSGSLVAAAMLFGLPRRGRFEEPLPAPA